MEYLLPLLLLLLIFVSALAPAAYALRKRLALPGERLEFWQVLRRRGLSGAEAAQNPRELGMALRRCTLCPAVEACNRWLSRDARERLQDFCPNAAYLEKLEREWNA